MSLLILFGGAGGVITPLSFDVPFTLTIAPLRRINLLANVGITFTMTATRVISLLAAVTFAFTMGVVRVIRKIADVVVSIAIGVSQLFKPILVLIVDEGTFTFNVQVTMQVNYLSVAPTDWNKITRELPPAGSTDKVP